MYTQWSVHERPKLNSSYVLVKESGKLKTGSNPIRNVNPDTV